MATAKPYQVWAQEAALAESAADRTMREVAQSGQAIGQALSGLQPRKPTVQPQLHDWDKSAMVAADRAAGLEKMDKGAALDRQNEEFKMQLRVKYAPKRSGGAGPVTKIVDRILKGRDESPLDDSHAERKRTEEAYLESQLVKYPGGKAALEDLRRAGISAATYKAVGKHGMAKEIESGRQAARTADQTRRDVAADTQLQARIGLSELSEQQRRSRPGTDMVELPGAKASRAQAAVEAEKIKERLRKLKVTAPGGATYTVEDDGED